MQRLVKTRCRGTARNVPTLLLFSALALIILAAGCGGNEEQDMEGQTNEQTQQRTEQTTREGTGSGGRSGDEATLEIEGDEGTEFSGRCTVGDEENEIGGRVPERYTYELGGERLQCEITNEGSGGLEVVFSAGESTRSVQRISGGTLNITYEDGQLSSFTSSSGGQVSSSQVVSSSQSNSSSVTIEP